MNTNAETKQWQEERKRCLKYRMDTLTFSSYEKSDVSIIISFSLHQACLISH